MIQTTSIANLMILQARVFGDERGYFFESYNKKQFADLGLHYDFVQDNQARSTYGVLRGLHFQKGDYAQTKLVRVTEGKVLDVVVDLRPQSVTYGEVFSIILSAENKKQLLVPRGFAHGYVVLSETAIFQYKCDNYYAKNHEGGIIYNDPTLNIDWQVPAQDLVVSEKDLKLPFFKY